ncbi:MAG: transketolase [Clostridiales bacterium]|jgi:transketolase|nr:transketolase subunit [Oscillospiraceae bacterium]MDN5378879.1 transketolase [Clostridiales bacterium]
MENLKAKAFEIRENILDMVYRAKAGHIGGDFSVCDILVSLYYSHMNVSPQDMDNPNRDRFILSKGHSVEALYCVLADRGFFPKEDLETFSAFGSKYIGHPNNKVNGIEMNSGSLGHGLSVAVGMAIAAKMDNAPYRVYTVMGDGELAEGSVWEGAMAAGHYKLDNLTAVIDRNRLQISGTTEEVMTQDSQEERWNSFGWNVIKAKGNDINDLDRAFNEAKACKGKPSIIIAETVKGCGVSFMENSAKWHHKVPSDEEYAMAKAELKEKRRLAYEQNS